MAKHVEVILLQDVPNLGTRGAIVTVRSGYARNYLIPRGLATPATASAKKQIEHLRRSFEQRALRARAHAEAMKTALEAETFVIPRPAGREDLLFQAVTRDEIARLLAQKGYRVDRRDILLDRPIKRAGNYTIPVRLFEDVRATIRLEIVPETKQESL